MFKELHTMSQTIVCWCPQHPSTEELLNLHLEHLITYGKSLETEDADEDANLLDKFVSRHDLTPAASA